MSDPKHDEKYEKELSKQDEKQEEKSAEEKSYEEKYRRDPLSAIIWAVILIWGGVVFLVNNLGVLDQITIRFAKLPEELPFEFPDQALAIFFIGTALILLLEVVIRLVVPDYRRPVLGTVFLACVFFGIGTGSWEIIFPIFLIGLGLSFLLRRR